MTPPTDAPRHGTVARYHGTKYRCRCDLCTRAASRYGKNRTVLADRGHTLTVPRAGFERRVRALQVIGYPLTTIAAELGLQLGALSHKLDGRGDRVRRATHDRMVEVYDRLSMTPGPSHRTIVRAAGKGWAPPLAWDDETIDDPAATPYRPRKSGKRANPETQLVDEVVVQRAMNGQRVQATRAERTEIRDHWTRAGRSIQQLDQLQGWNLHRDQRLTDRAA